MSLREVLTSGVRTMAHGALACIWVIDCRMIPIPDFRTIQKVRENVAAMEFGPMSEEVVQQVQEIVAERMPTAEKGFGQRDAAHPRRSRPTAQQCQPSAAKARKSSS